jgi:hypothetical protein
MGNIGGIILLSTLVLTGCASPAEAPIERAASVQPAASAMLTELRPHLTALKASDSDLLAEAYGACAVLALRGKDSYREDVMNQYPDVTLAVDHLTVAAAAEQHLCR